MRKHIASTAYLLVLCAAFLGSADAEGQVASRVFINGVPTPVHFNDGDSFKVLAGPHIGSQTRLAGFNTLESYGPSHIWGSWTMRELFYIAKQGTVNARKGVWQCNTDGSRDGYGRLLLDCLDLAVDQVTKGLAHGMTVTADPAHPKVVEAQKEAMAARRGMWAHGVPELIMTSTHSATEGHEKGPANRLIATADGHSEMWEHTLTFRECQIACVPAGEDTDKEKLPALVAALRADPKLTAGLSVYDDASLLVIATELIEKGAVSGDLKDEGLRLPLEEALAAAAASGRYTKTGKIRSCMNYVAFNRRYGGSKAVCLKIR